MMRLGLGSSPCVQGLPTHGHAVASCTISSPAEGREHRGTEGLDTKARLRSPV